MPKGIMQRFIYY